MSLLLMAVGASCTRPAPAAAPPANASSGPQHLVAPVVVARPSAFLLAYARGTELEPRPTHAGRVEVGPLPSLYEAELLAQLAGGQIERRDPFERVPLASVPAELLAQEEGLVAVNAWRLEGEGPVWRVDLALQEEPEQVLEISTVWLQDGQLTRLAQEGFPWDAYQRSAGLVRARSGQRLAWFEEEGRGMDQKTEQLRVGGEIVARVRSAFDDQGRRTLEVVRLGPELEVRRFRVLIELEGPTLVTAERISSEERP